MLAVVTYFLRMTCLVITTLKSHWTLKYQVITVVLVRLALLTVVQIQEMKRIVRQVAARLLRKGKVNKVTLSKLLGLINING